MRSEVPFIAPLKNPSDYESSTYLSASSFRHIIQVLGDYLVITISNYESSRLSASLFTNIIHVLGDYLVINTIKILSSS